MAKHNVRAKGSRTVHSGDPRVKCGFRDRIDPSKVEYTDLPVNCAHETDHGRPEYRPSTPKGGPPMEDQPAEVAEETREEQPIREHTTTIVRRPGGTPVTQIIATALGRLSGCIAYEHGAPRDELAKEIESVGLDLIRLAARIEVDQ